MISPTAALASFPYAPEYSMQALRDYGFKDAFRPAGDWIAESYLAIDQGPIVVMIENFRSALLWRLFMSCPEVQDGLAGLGFAIRPPGVA